MLAVSAAITPKTAQYISQTGPSRPEAGPKKRATDARLPAPLKTNPPTREAFMTQQDAPRRT
eukprot:2284740-Pyramimonas_sp.AAC.1